ncbi:hypothetical protein TNCT_8121 [Trichonephila clavata]|uniref:Uncharacterized protein n=2 Tax=Trichonephila clavata TaxID=2740835 RepID=A0A8X6JXY7_TRICU|nr:hypothetical protein TNCT_8121 [Trichonephila clavata]
MDDSGNSSRNDKYVETNFDDKEIPRKMMMTKLGVLGRRRPFLSRLPSRRTFLHQGIGEGGKKGFSSSSSGRSSDADSTSGVRHLQITFLDFFEGGRERFLSLFVYRKHWISVTGTRNVVYEVVTKILGVMLFGYECDNGSFQLTVKRLGCLIRNFRPEVYIRFP